MNWKQNENADEDTNIETQTNGRTQTDRHKKFEVRCDCQPATDPTDKLKKAGRLEWSSVSEHMLCMRNMRFVPADRAAGSAANFRFKFE